MLHASVSLCIVCQMLLVPRTGGAGRLLQVNPASLAAGRMAFFHNVEFNLSVSGVELAVCALDLGIQFVARQ
jgi:hypothetical protein